MAWLASSSTSSCRTARRAAFQEAPGRASRRTFSEFSWSASPDDTSYQRQAGALRPARLRATRRKRLATSRAPSTIFGTTNRWRSTASLLRCRAEASTHGSGRGRPPPPAPGTPSHRRDAARDPAEHGPVPAPRDLGRLSAAATFHFPARNSMTVVPLVGRTRSRRGVRRGALRLPPPGDGGPGADRPRMNPEAPMRFATRASAGDESRAAFSADGTAKRGPADERRRNARSLRRNGPSLRSMHGTSRANVVALLSLHPKAHGPPFLAWPLFPFSRRANCTTKKALNAGPARESGAVVFSAFPEGSMTESTIDRTGAASASRRRAGSRAASWSTGRRRRPGTLRSHIATPAGIALRVRASRRSASPDTPNKINRAVASAKNAADASWTRTRA